MPGLISNLTGYPTNFDAGVPNLSDQANIVDAFKYYHYGPNYNGTGTVGGISGHLENISNTVSGILSSTGAEITISPASIFSETQKTISSKEYFAHIDINSNGSQSKILSYVSNSTDNIYSQIQMYPGQIYISSNNGTDDAFIGTWEMGSAEISGSSSTTIGRSTSLTSIVGSNFAINGVVKELGLPQQAAQSGKYLKTNGTVSSWSNISWGELSGTLSDQGDLNTALGLKANLSSPSFIGIPTSTTAAVDTNTSQIATTAFVIGQGYLKSSTASSTYAPLSSPTLVTPNIGVATATSVNKVAITAPATSATLTLANGSTLATSGAFSVTLTSTATTALTLPTSGNLIGSNDTGTITTAMLASSTSTTTGVTYAKMQQISAQYRVLGQIATAGAGAVAELAPNDIVTILGQATVTSSRQGTGAVVLANSPTLITPVLGVATATSINKVAITAPATSATLSIADGSTLATSGAFSITLTSTGATNVTLPTSGTLTTVTGVDTQISNFFTTQRSRTTATVTTSSIANNAAWSGTINLGFSYRIISVQTSVPARVRLYDTGTNLIIDDPRPIGTDPVGEHGVMMDMVTTVGNLNYTANPTIDGYNNEVPLSTNIPISVTNLSGSSTAIIVTLTYIRSE